jgi:hypothetical protein
MFKNSLSLVFAILISFAAIGCGAGNEPAELCQGLNGNCGTGTGTDTSTDTTTGTDTGASTDTATATSTNTDGVPDFTNGGQQWQLYGTTSYGALLFSCSFRVTSQDGETFYAARSGVSTVCSGLPDTFSGTLTKTGFFTLVFRGTTLTGQTRVVNNAVFDLGGESWIDCPDSTKVCSTPGNVATSFDPHYGTFIF